MIQEFAKFMMFDSGKSSPQTQRRYEKYLRLFKEKVEKDVSEKYEKEFEAMKAQLNKLTPK